MENHHLFFFFFQKRYDEWVLFLLINISFKISFLTPFLSTCLETDSLLVNISDRTLNGPSFPPPSPQISKSHKHSPGCSPKPRNDPLLLFSSSPPPSAADLSNAFFMTHFSPSVSYYPCLDYWYYWSKLLASLFITGLLTGLPLLWTPVYTPVAKIILFKTWIRTWHWPKTLWYFYAGLGNKTNKQSNKNPIKSIPGSSRTLLRTSFS